jgi:hypothetical protein
MDVVDEKLTLVEKLKIYEEQNSLMQKDLETLILRIEELELINA